MRHQIKSKWGKNIDILDREELICEMIDLTASLRVIHINWTAFFVLN